MPNGSRDRTVEAVNIKSARWAPTCSNWDSSSQTREIASRSCFPACGTMIRSGARSVGCAIENRDGRNIYIRPKGEHNLSLVDDLTATAIAEMLHVGFTPAAVVETSSGNFQAWLKHPERLGQGIGARAQERRRVGVDHRLVGRVDVELHARAAVDELDAGDAPDLHARHRDRLALAGGDGLRAGQLGLEAQGRGVDERQAHALVAHDVGADGESDRRRSRRGPAGSGPGASRPLRIIPFSCAR